MCIGRSPLHAGSVDLVLNPETVHVALKFNLVFNDGFSVLPIIKEGTITPNWIDLVQKLSQGGAS